MANFACATWLVLISAGLCFELCFFCSRDLPSFVSNVACLYVDLDSSVLYRGQTIDILVQSGWVPWFRTSFIVLQINSAVLNSVRFCFQTSVRLIFQADLHCLLPTYYFVLDRRQTIEISVRRAECHDFERLVYCFARFWWRILLSCRLTWPDLNTVQLSIAFKDGDLWRFHGRISSFWTFSGCFRCIVVLSKSGAGDIAMRTTPRVALEEENRGENTSTRFIWQHEPSTPSRRHTISWLCTEWSRRQQCYTTRSVYEGFFGGGSKCAAAYKTTFDIVTYPRLVASLVASHFQNLGVSKEPVWDASCQLHYRTTPGS